MSEAVPPRATLKVVGETLRVKSPAEVTFSVTLAEWLRVDVAPVSVSVYDPAGVPAEVATLSVEDPDPVTDVGANVAEAPAGRPETDRLTVSEKPFSVPIATLYEAPDPGTTDCEDGEPEIEKSGAGFTVIVRVGGFGSAKFALSVTVSVAVYEPAVAYVMLPGDATELVLGVPPGKVQA